MEEDDEEEFIKQLIELLNHLEDGLCNGKWLPATEMTKKKQEEAKGLQSTFLNRKQTD